MEELPAPAVFHTSSTTEKAHQPAPTTPQPSTAAAEDLPPQETVAACIPLRAIHHVRVIDPQEALEAGLEISEQTIAKIERLSSKIFWSKSENDSEIQWFPSDNNVVFKFKQTEDGKPSLIFKTSHQDDEFEMQERFKNMITAKEVCMTHQLGLLVIPHAILFKVAGKTFIAEEELDINPEESAQKHLYHVTDTESFKPTIDQVTTFIAHTGFHDVTWRNIPLLNEASGHHGARRVGLIDLEHMDIEKVDRGFKGDPESMSQGLIGCMSTNLVDHVVNAAKTIFGEGSSLVRDKEPEEIAMIHEEMETAGTKRKETLKRDVALDRFYAAKGIQRGNEPIQVDEGLLDFSADYPEQAEELKGLAKALIAELNKNINRRVFKETIKEHRYTYIDPKTIQAGVKPAIPLGVVVNKLIGLGVLFDYQGGDYGYFIQA